MKVTIKRNDEGVESQKGDRGYMARTDSHRKATYFGRSAAEALGEAVRNNVDVCGVQVEFESSDAACRFEDLAVGKSFIITDYPIPACVMAKLPEVCEVNQTSTQNTMCMPPDGEAFLINVSDHVMVEPKK